MKTEDLVIQKVDSQYTLYNMILITTHGNPVGHIDIFHLLVAISYQNGVGKADVY